MNPKLSHKILAAVCAFALLLGLAPTAFAADGFQPPVIPSPDIQPPDMYHYVTGDSRPALYWNPSHSYGGNWATTTKFYLYANEKGGLTRVVAPASETPNQLRVEEYSDSFYYLSGRYLTFDALPLWGGFFAGKDCNFVITGQNNLNDSK